MAKLVRLLFILTVLALPTSRLSAQVYSNYGDDDGFGIGATTGALDATVSHHDVSDADFTDERLIADTCCGWPAFAPTGSFEAFTAPPTIGRVVLTMRAGSLTRINPVDGANTIVLDGQAIPASFFDQFTANDACSPQEDPAVNQVETKSIELDPSFYPLVADGQVSLDGTHISAGDGCGSFQIDFLQLEVDPPGVPATDWRGLIALWLILLLGGAAMLVYSRRFQRA